MHKVFSLKSDIKSASKRIFHTGSTSSPIMHFSHTLNFQDLYFKFDAELITYANCTFITGAVHVIVRTQKRCCPLVLSEVSHEHSTTADSRSESGSASYITWSPHHGIALSYRVEESPHLLKTSARSSMMV